MQQFRVCSQSYGDVFKFHLPVTKWYMVHGHCTSQHAQADFLLRLKHETALGPQVKRQAAAAEFPSLQPTSIGFTRISLADTFPVWTANR
jgi:hypothetical protein